MNLNKNKDNYKKILNNKIRKLHKNKIKKLKI